MSCWQDKIDGTLHSINETFTNWDDIRVPVLSTRAGGTKDPDFAKLFDNGAGSQGVFTYHFDKSTEEELYFAIQMPHQWKQGTNLHAHVHWVPVVDGGVGTKVSWGLEYTVQEIGSIFGNTIISYGNTPVITTVLTADKHYLTEVADIDMSSIDSVSTMLLCRVFRDATSAGLTDDYDADAALLEIDFHYQIDSLGSRFEYIK